MIGKGSQGTVYEIEDLSKPSLKLAIKLSDDLAQLKEEAKIMRKIAKARDEMMSQDPYMTRAYVVPVMAGGVIKEPNTQADYYFYVMPKYQYSLDEYLD